MYRYRGWGVRMDGHQRVSLAGKRNDLMALIGVTQTSCCIGNFPNTNRLFTRSSKDADYSKITVSPNVGTSYE